jgi:hypothetical protein
MKIAKKALQDVFFYSEDGHFLKVNWLAKTMNRIDQKVCKAIQLLKRCQSTI